MIKDFNAFELIQAQLKENTLVFTDNFPLPTNKEHVRIFKKIISAIPNITGLSFLHPLNKPQLNTLSELLKEFPETTSLHLENTNSVECVKYLQHASSLKNLTHIGLNDKEALGCLAQFDPLPHLVSLALLSGNIGREEINTLAASNTFPHLASIDLSYNNKWKEVLAALAESTLLKNLTSINLSHARTEEKELRSLSKFPNLTSIDLSHNDIGEKELTILAESTLLKSLTSINLSYTGIEKKELKLLSRFLNLASINLSYNNIEKEELKEYLQSPAATNLTFLEVSGLELGVEMSTFLAKNHKIKVEFNEPKTLTQQMDFFILKTFPFVYQEGQPVNKNLLKTFIFTLAFHDHNFLFVNYFLERPEEYPFQINSKDKSNISLWRYYNHRPAVQAFLFEHGAIPEDPLIQKITFDRQSTHITEITKAIHFLTNKLLHSPLATTEAQNSAEEYLSNLKTLSKNLQAPIKLKLLHLNMAEKKNIIEEAKFFSEAALKDDKKFINAVIDKVVKVLNNQYLKKDKHGNYVEGYPTELLQYDWEKGKEKWTTIPECIGQISFLINKMEVPLNDKRALFTLLLENNKDLLAKNNLRKIQASLGDSSLSVEQLTNPASCHEILNKIPHDQANEKINSLFKEISNNDVDKIWKEQKQFVLAKNLYVAATTYGDNNSACVQGAWAQIINSLSEIQPKWVDAYSEKQEATLKKEIISESIREYAIQLSKHLIKEAMKTSDLKEPLGDFALSMVEIDNPEDITLEQQKILAMINQHFPHIKETIPNYTRDMPTREEYKTIINAIGMTSVMERFFITPQKTRMASTMERIKRKFLYVPQEYSPSTSKNHSQGRKLPLPPKPKYPYLYSISKAQEEEIAESNKLSLPPKPKR